MESVPFEVRRDDGVIQCGETGRIWCARLNHENNNPETSRHVMCFRNAPRVDLKGFRCCVSGLKSPFYPFSTTSSRRTRNLILPTRARRRAGLHCKCFPHTQRTRR